MPIETGSLCSDFYCSIGYSVLSSMVHPGLQLMNFDLQQWNLIFKFAAIWFCLLQLYKWD